jgi:replication-associated recombination protein RarA
MSRWLEHASLFEEGGQSPYFEVRSAYAALSTIKSALQERLGQMIFLIGQPGSGKTYLLNHLKNTQEMSTPPLLFETPLLTPLTFLRRLIEHHGQIPAGEEIEELKKQAQDLYKEKKTLIMLDEAQLLSAEMLEFVRILSDSRLFWIVFAMHEAEGRKILQQSHFKSRPHTLIELGRLSVKELDIYLNTQLIFSRDSTVLKFHQRHVKKIYTLTQGNFRYLKKLLYTEFMLLHEAQEMGMKKFQEPSKCLLSMAAIEIGLINV